MYLVAFFVARLFVLVLYREDFAGLTAGQVVYSFFRGVLFDSSVVLTFAGLPLLLLTLPFGWAGSSWWRGIWGWYGFAAFTVFTFVLGGDVVYFGYVHRHTGPEAAALAEESAIILSTAFRDHLGTVLVTLLLLCGLGYVWHLFVRGRADRVRRKVLATVASVLILAAMIVTVRGGFGGKPLNIVNAFEGLPPAGGYLVLNGPFSFFHSVRTISYVDVEKFPPEDAVRLVRGMLASERERFVDDEYPLLRERTVEEKGRPNVVLIMLESLDAARVDCIRAGDGLEPQGSTPTFDSLSRNGVLFTRFYANGQRSADAFSCMLAGVPRLPGIPYMGRGMEQSRLCYIGRIAKREGYSTHCVRGARRSSYRLDAISDVAGFDHYYGSQDISSTGHPERSARDGVWDHDMFTKAHQVFASARKPFLGFVFTFSSHGPRVVPGEEWEKHPPSVSLNRYLNSLYYSDWALGQFFENAKRSGYYDDTVFVLFADHASGRSAIPGDFSSLHHVACLMIAPGLEPGVCRTVGSQLDILPTVMDLAGWGGRHASVGRSLLDESSAPNASALCVRGQAVTWIQADGWVAHNLQKRLASKRLTDGADLDLMEKRLLSFTQVISALLRENRAFRSEGE